MQIIPAIDLKDGRCVRLAQGQFDKATVYGDDPIAVAENFAAAGAQRIHVVDLDGALNGRESTNRAVVKKMAERLSVPIQFGGGIRTLSDVEDLINSGVASIILGTLATESLRR
jgi:phosphoribosylformimino-5-aminoimidazole carboxamide ribotide isomerase